jgi:predicted nuclease of restriction endonuclease-like (RecB) superfamily
MKNKKNQPFPNEKALIKDIKHLIDETRKSVAKTVNTALTMMYWRIGERINKEILLGNRAEYGREIVKTLSSELFNEYGTGFSEKNIRRMIQFYEVYPENQIVASLMRQLSWTHFIVLLPIKDKLQRDFYAEMCRLEHWSVRTLRKKIDSMLYERTAISKKPEELIKSELQNLKEQDQLTPDLVFKDPYVLDFLNLKDTYSEKDLETAILAEMEKTILELGPGFTFISRQKRIMIDNEDHYIDLLFYHRKLKRLIVIELKLGKFKAADKGQMELYLRWLEKNEMEPGEGNPLGLILCSGSSNETINLLQLDEAGIHVAEYLTDLPPREILERKLHAAVKNAKARLEYFEEG